MLKLVVGFAAGIWVGTNYDCKPYIASIVTFVKGNIPPKRD